MNVAILSESAADEAAVRLLVEAVLGQPVELVPPRYRARGWGAIPDTIAATVPAVYYSHSGSAEGLVVVLDSNSSPVHTGAVAALCDDVRCRLCMARRAVARAVGKLRAVVHRGPLRTAVGLAVPAIEAWYLCGNDPNVSENAWVQARAEGQRPYPPNQLKERVYGTDRPSLERETACATREAVRIASDLDMLERKFPIGFGALRSALGNWVAPKTDA